MELEPAVAWLRSILATQGKAVPPKKLSCLCKWAQDKGHLADPALVFSVPEWRAIGHTLWDTIMDGDKGAKNFRALWKDIVTALEKYRAETQLAAAARAFLGKTTPEAGGGTRLFTVGNSAAGLEVPTKPSAADLYHTGGQIVPPSSSSSQSGGPAELNRAGEQAPPPLPSSQSGGAAEGSNCTPSAPPPPPSYREAANELSDSGDEGGRGDHCSDGGSSDGDCEMPEQKSSPCNDCRKPSDHLLSQITKKMENLPSPSLPSCGNVPSAEPMGVPVADSVTAVLSDLGNKPVTGSVGDVTITASSGLNIRPLTSGRWSGVIKNAILEGDWEAVGACSSAPVALPVRFVNNPAGDGNAIAQYTPFEWKLVEKIRATVSTYGLHSEPARQMINYLFTSNVLTPEDCVTFARMILTSTGFLQWERYWEEECKRIANEPRQVGDPLYAVTLEMLMGKGPYALAAQQLRFPLIMHKASGEAAKNALLRIPPEKKLPNWATIKQGLTESFDAFVNRLVASIEAATEIETDMKARLLKTFAYENANEKTKLILSTLPRDADIADMLDRTAHVGYQKQTACFTEAVKAVSEQVQVMSNAVAGQTQVLAATMKSRAGGRRRSDRSAECHRCGLRGHFRDQCTGPVWCERCKVNTHSTLACRKSGNSSRSARGSRARTKVAAPLQPTGALPPLPGAWEPTWQQQ